MPFRRFATFCSLTLAFPLASVACGPDAFVPPSEIDAATSSTASATALPSATAPGSDASTTVPTTDAAPPSPDAKPAVCNDLVNLATDVSVDSDPSEPPTAEGGTFVDGTYLLTRATVYTGPGGASGPSGETMRMTLRKDGPRYDSILKGVARRAEVTIDGTNLVTKSICPSISTRTIGFTATSTSLMIRFPESGGTRVYVYERR